MSNPAIDGGNMDNLVVMPTNNEEAKKHENDDGGVNMRFNPYPGDHE